VVANSPEGAKPGAAYELGWNAVNELIREDVTWSGYERNVLYLNNGDGTFSDASGATGLDFPEDSRTFALADFDGDGSVEMVLKSRSAPQLRYLKNVMPQLAPSISFRLTGKKSNRDAIGTQVIVETSMGRQTRLVQAGSGFLAQHSKELFFGLGAVTGNIRATIRWPSGLLQNIADLPANHRIWIEEGSAAIRKEAFAWRPAVGGQKSRANPPAHEPSPAQVETWLLVPVAAPDFQANGSSVNPGMLAGLRGRTVLLYFGSVKMPDWEKQLEELRGAQDAGGSRVIAVNVEDEASVRPSTQAAVSAASVVPVVHGSPDLVGIYNLLYGRLFDRHRNMGLPTVFLLDSKGDIVKIYQGPLQAQQVLEDARHVPKTDAERLQRALPFPGVNTTYEFGRNYLSFGAVFYERDYLSQSEAYFRLAAKDDPNGAEALYGLGSVYLKQNKNAEAREYFERASRAEARYPGTLPNTWNNLGILAAREGKTDEAIGYFQKALQFNPDNAVALQNLGNAYRQKKDWPNAKSALGRSLALNPDDPEANYGLGMVYAQNDDTGRAYDYLQRALAARPAYPEALNNLAILYLRTQHPQEAQ
jgi:Flp pilus assembly protein TadD